MQLWWTDHLKKRVVLINIDLRSSLIFFFGEVTDTEYHTKFYSMKTILSLKDIFKKRQVSNDEVITIYDNIADTVTIDLLRGKGIDAAQVALASNIMSLAASYNNRKFAIDLLQGALAELESEHFVENGGRLS
jgi:hypothetical protein